MRRGTRTPKPGQIVANETRGATVIFRRILTSLALSSLLWLVIITLIFASFIINDRNKIHANKENIAKNTESLNEVETCCDNVDLIQQELDQCLPACLDVQANSSDFMFNRGCWDANTNEPTLVSDNCTLGDVYVVCNSGTTNLQGIQTWSFSDNLRCINVSGTTQWIKNAASSGGGGGGGGGNITLHTFDYSDPGDPNLEQLPSHVIGYFWEDGAFVFIRGIANGLRHINSQTNLTIGNLPLQPTSFPVGVIDAFTHRTVSVLENARAYGVVTVLEFDTGTSSFLVNVDSQDNQDIDIRFELFYNTI